MKIGMEKDKESCKNITKKRYRKGMKDDNSTGKTGEKSGKIKGSNERWLE